MFMQVDAVSLKHVEKFNYLRVGFVSNGREGEQLNFPSGKVCAVMQALHHVLK